jgi:hypothetical protein
LRVPFQNVFDAQENIPESRTAHQGQSVRQLHRATTRAGTSLRSPPNRPWTGWFDIYRGSSLTEPSHKRPRQTTPDPSC